MMSVSKIYSSPPFAMGSRLEVRGILLGGGGGILIADSVEDFDVGFALPIQDDDIDERMILRGIFPLAGGRFGYQYPCVIRGVIAEGDNGYKYSLKSIAFLAVTASGHETLIVEDCTTEQDGSEEKES
ncbi:MAG: hypothetical protein K2X38_14070 [Gemmataceae bacterium]|nr:hypothetical protein [Gemmataceae bacterium]